MTNLNDGSSLLQAPAYRLHRRHSHHDVHHRRNIVAADGHMHLHTHHHRQHDQHVLPNAQPEPESRARDQEGDQDGDQDTNNQDLRRRQLDIVDDLDSVVTHIVQTVSVVQYIDGTGSALGVSTISSPLQTEAVDRTTGVPPAPSPADLLPTTPGSSSLGPVLSPGSIPASYPVLSSSPSSDSSASASIPPAPTTLSSSFTSYPPLNSSSFPSFSGAFNSSSSSANIPFSNSTLRNFFLNSSSTSQTSLSSSWTTSTEATLTPSPSSSESTIESTTTTGAGIVGGAGGSWGTGAVPAPTGTDSAAPAGTSTPPTPTTAIVGGVVGSICGVALLVFAVMFVLRWRKLQQNGHKLLGDGDGRSVAGSRSRGLSNSMSERRGPFSVPAALAALSAGSSKQQAAAGSGAETGERGFYRVSGRKLPSVLQHGGDGYTNPHDSTMSGDSDIFYRDSQAFFGGAPTRLAVGSPMRPESGVVVMQPGPARTPVTGQSPVVTPSPTLSPFGHGPLLPRTDEIGRSLPSMDGSRTSASRFTENVT